MRNLNLAETALKSLMLCVIKTSADTLIGFQLFSWTASKKRKATTTAKFYFFDIGVANTLSGIQFLDRNSDLFKNAFEHFIANELRAYLSYKRNRNTLSFWRTKHGAEVDFLVGNKIAIEVKSTQKTSTADYKNIHFLQEEGVFQDFYLVSMDTIETLSKDSIHTVHWKTFLTRLWQDKIVF